MTFGGRKASFLLFIGDIAAFALSLWVTLFVRFGEVPSYELLHTHLVPFSALFIIWMLVFYMSGLYGKRVVLFSRELPAAILRTQVFNIIIAALFFFLFEPAFGVTPKTILLIYLIVSLFAIFLWRLVLFPKVTTPGFRARAALVGEGPDTEELVREVNGNKRYHLEFKVTITPEDLVREGETSFAKRLQENGISIIVVDTESDAARPLLPMIYDLALIDRRYQFADFYDIYEEIFDRVPLSLVRFEWFLRNVSSSTAVYYSLIKRLLDIVGGLLMGLVTLLVLPFVFVAMRLEGPGPLFIAQERIGRFGTRMRAYKFRSMRFSDAGAWKGEGENRVTRVGAFLRVTSLDEFPQFINILRGELSLIGPRNDIEVLGKRLADAIPYYNIRYGVKPGITGWAQINQQYEQGNISPQSVEETKLRLAYDFYYIKHRSLALDLVIALKTVKRMLFRVSTF